MTPLPVRIRAGRTTEVTVENRRLPGALVIRKVNPTGQLLPGACFSIWTVASDGTRDRRLTRACDGDDSAADGVTNLPDLPPGDLLVHEDVPPRGYRRAEDRAITVTSGEATEITMENAPRRGAAGTGAGGPDAQTEPTPVPATPTLTPIPTPEEPPVPATPAMATVPATATPAPSATPAEETVSADGIDVGASPVASEK